MKKISLIILFSVVSCAYHDDDECLNRLKEDLIINIDQSKIVNLDKDVNCFEWDSIMFTEPSILEDVIEDKTGVELSSVKLIGIKGLIQNEYYYCMIFLKNKKVVAKLELELGAHPENMLDGMKRIDMTLIARRDAIFKLYRGSDDFYANGKKLYKLGFYRTKDSLKYINQN